MTGQKKHDLFKKELKALLLKYDAEISLEDNGKTWTSNFQIVIDFNYDNKLDNSGIVPQWIIGTWENGE